MIMPSSSPLTPLVVDTESLFAVLFYALSASPPHLVEF